MEKETKRLLRKLVRLFDGQTMVCTTSGGKTTAISFASHGKTAS